MPDLRRWFLLSTVLVSWTALLFPVPAQADPVALQCWSGEYRIETDTLKIDWHEGDETLPISAAVADQTTADLERSQQAASWNWPEAETDVEAHLDDCVLRLALAAKRVGSLAWYELPSQSADTLLLPFSEGMRVPTDDPRWIRFLRGRRSGSDTTWDLKLPLWTMQGTGGAGRFVHVVVDNPHSNQMFFDEAEGRLALRAVHQFTELNQQEPMQVSYSVGGHSLSGAIRYRRERAARGEAEPLDVKAEHRPDVLKLIGAPHVNLHGSGILHVDDVADWKGLQRWYFASALAKQTREPGAAELEELRGGPLEMQYLRWLLVSAIDDGLRRLLVNEFTLDDSRYVEGQFRAAQRRREWLAKEAGEYLHDSGSWGQGLSQQHVATLQAAGLDRLWLAVSDWQAAFYQPDVVDRAKKLGWLVATYDSYNTGIDPSTNESWTTAHFPAAVRDGCAYVRADGSRVKGFKQLGVYMNPRCLRQVSRHRIAEVLRWGRFNSLFLDADATGSVREDRPSRLASPPVDNPWFAGREDMTEPQVAEAFNARLGWAAKKAVVGSEDGNAVTTRGLSLAHGMESVLFGWGDDDMRTDRSSPYFVGGWYPPHRPENHFRRVPVKEPYKTLLFAPEFRVPLYQAVFHHEVVNSHHWEMDNLKLEDVGPWRDLQGMLYVTAPMVHLSRSDVRSERADRIRAIRHYRDGYGPLHEALWDKTLERFEWLDDAGRVQRTRFSDGSTLVANFRDEPVEVDGQTIPAKSLRAKLKSGDRPEFVWTSAQ